MNIIERVKENKLIAAMLIAAIWGLVSTASADSVESAANDLGSRAAQIEAAVNGQ